MISFWVDIILDLDIIIVKSQIENFDGGIANMVSIKKIVLLGIVLLVCIILRGLIWSSFWDWFIVSIFNFPELPLISAIGIVLLDLYIRGSNSSNITEIEKISVAEIIKVHFFIPLTYLFCGWIVHLFA